MDQCIFGGGGNTLPTDVVQGLNTIIGDLRALIPLFDTTPLTPSTIQQMLPIVGGMIQLINTMSIVYSSICPDVFKTISVLQANVNTEAGGGDFDLFTDQGFVNWTNTEPTTGPAIAIFLSTDPNGIAALSNWVNHPS